MAVPTIILPNVSETFEQLMREVARGASALQAIPHPSVEVGVSRAERHVVLAEHARVVHGDVVTVSVAVEAGVAFLDERYGRTEWLQRVNLDTLDVHSQLDCVLAQVTGKTYVEALDVVGVPTSDSGFARTRWTDAHGFSRDLTPDHWASHVRYTRLTEAWATKITELRSEEVVK